MYYYECSLSILINDLYWREQQKKLAGGASISSTPRETLIMMDDNTAVPSKLTVIMSTLTKILRRIKRKQQRLSANKNYLDF